MPESTTAEPSGSPTRALCIVSLAVLLASSTWLSGTAAGPSLERDWNLSEAQSAWLTISVQLGFLLGTLLYAVTNLADVFEARRVFLVSALLGATANAAFAWTADSLGEAVFLRGLTGVTLAGVYPVGMKLVATWFQGGLGGRLGVLVGALTVGTASPFLVRWVGLDGSWRTPVLAASGLAVMGGVLLVSLVGEGPYLRARARFDWRVMGRVFKHRPFRLTASGYFGHMWELYAFWTLLAYALTRRADVVGDLTARQVPLVVFAVIAVGALGCVLGGWWSQHIGERRVALVSMAASATFCLISGWIAEAPLPLFLGLLGVWGMVVVSDSPQCSALAARHAPSEYTGTALTVQNGIGFTISVGSIQLLPFVADAVTWRWAFVALAPGPLLGAWAMSRLGRCSE